MPHIAGESSLTIATIPLDNSSKVTALASRFRTGLLFCVPLPEAALALGFLVISMIVARSFGLQLQMPSTSALQFTGMSYGVPLSLIGALGVFLLVTKQAWRLAYYVAAALAYGIILIAHFNLKQWMSIINPSLWDSFYWQSDEMVRPLITLSFAVHDRVDMILPAGNQLYLFAFLAMFGCSIIVHSAQSFIVFRKVLFAAMLVHVTGALSYLIVPAIGPFIYEQGANLIETDRQAHMYESYQALMAGGRVWIESEGSHFLFAAVAAMPSLHVASSAVFVYFAWRHARWLCWVYLPLFTFIMFEAVATRWHYVIDVFAGLALTALAILITAFLFRPIEAYHAAQR